MNSAWIYEDLLNRADRLSNLAYQLSACDGLRCDECSVFTECNRCGGSRNLTLVMCSSIIDQLSDAVERVLGDSIQIHSFWELTESPYAEIEEGADGESHPRYTCHNCGGEAGFECDPWGFASGQEKTPYCQHCHAIMDAKQHIGSE